MVVWAPVETRHSGAVTSAVRLRFLSPAPRIPEVAAPRDGLALNPQENRTSLDLSPRQGAPVGAVGRWLRGGAFFPIISTVFAVGPTPSDRDGAISDQALGESICETRTPG